MVDNPVFPVTDDVFYGWERLTQPLGSQLAFFPMPGGLGRRLYAVSTSVTVGQPSIWMSDDDGLTWTTVAMPATRCWRFMVHTGTRYVIVCSSTTVGLGDYAAWSTDGVNWNEVPLPNAWVRFQPAVCGNVIIPGHNNTSLQYVSSTDNGSTWTLQNSGVATAVALSFFSDGVSVVISNRYGTSGSNGLLLRSGNGGLSFSIVSSLQLASVTIVGWAGGCFYGTRSTTLVAMSVGGQVWTQFSASSPAGNLSGEPMMKGLVQVSGTSKYYSGAGNVFALGSPLASFNPTSVLTSTSKFRAESGRAFYEDSSNFRLWRSVEQHAVFINPSFTPTGSTAAMNAFAGNGAGTVCGLGTTASNGRTVYLSTDSGASYTVNTTALDASIPTSRSWASMCWDGSNFIGVATTSTTIGDTVYSPDGSTWNLGQQRPNTLGSAPSFTFVLPRVGGGAVCGRGYASNGQSFSITTCDIASGAWTSRTVPVFAPSVSLAWQSAGASGDGRFMIGRGADTAGVNPAVLFSGDNGVTWALKLLPNHPDILTVGTTTDIHAIGYDGNQWILLGRRNGGSAQTFIAFSTDDGDSWTWITIASDGSVLPIFRGLWSDGRGTTALFAATNVTGFHSPDGIEWYGRTTKEHSTGVFQFPVPVSTDNWLIKRQQGGTTDNSAIYTRSLNPRRHFGETFVPAGTVTGKAADRRAEFLADITARGGLTTETNGLESLTLGAGPSSPVLSFPTIARSANLTIPATSVVANTGVSGTFNTTVSGAVHIQIQGDGQLRVVFDTPVSAFGFYLTSIGKTTNARLAVYAVNDKGYRQRYVVPHNRSGSPSGNLVFFGVIDTVRRFREFTLVVEAGTSEIYGFDDLVLAA